MDVSNETLAKLLSGQAALQADVRAIRAALEEKTAQSRREADALFSSRDDHAQRLNSIERDYLPRANLRDHEKMQREDFGRLASQVDRIKVAVTRVMAVGGAVVVAVQLLLNWVGR